MQHKGKQGGDVSAAGQNDNAAGFSPHEAAVYHQQQTATEGSSGVQGQPAQRVPWNVLIY